MKRFISILFIVFLIPLASSGQVKVLNKGSSVYNINNKPDAKTIQTDANGNLYVDTTGNWMLPNHNKKLYGDPSSTDSVEKKGLWKVVHGSFAFDTTALKQNSEGLYCYLAGLSASNRNGGGWFVAIDSVYEEGGVAFDHPVQGKQWVRVEFLNNEFVNVKWFGAKGDGVSDDYNPILKAVNYVDNNHYILYFPSGVYLSSNTISFASKNQYKGVEILGDGITKTKIKFTGATGGIIFDRYLGTYSFYGKIAKLSVEGNVQTKVNGVTGIYLDGTTNVNLTQVKVDSFGYGLFLDENHGVLVENCDFRDNIIGAVVYQNNNDNVFIATDFYRNDSVGVKIDYGRSNVFYGGEITANKRGFYTNRGVSAALISVHAESNDTLLYVNQNAQILVKDVSVQVPSPNGLFAVSDGGIMLMENIFIDNASSFPYHILSKQQQAYILDLGNSSGLVVSYAGAYNYNVGSIPAWHPLYLPGAGSSYDGRLFRTFKRSGVSNEPTNIVFYRQMSDGVYFKNYIADNSDVRFPNGSNFQRVEFLRRYEGNFSIDTNSGTYTDTTITFTSAGVQKFLSYNATLASSTLASDASVRILSTNSAAGSVTFRIYHPSNTGGGITVWVSYNIAVQAKETDY